MRVIEEIVVGSAKTKVLVKELTLAEIRAWMDAAATSQEPPDLLDDLFEDKNVLISDLFVFSDAPKELIEDLAPSEIEALIDKVRAVNLRFFEMWRRRMAAARSAMIAPGASPATSPA